MHELLQLMSKTGMVIATTVVRRSGKVSSRDMQTERIRENVL